jgi:hypothetical protein
VIYLSFNESSLLCSVWSQGDDKSILTQISQIPLTGDLDDARGNDKVFNAILEQAFKTLSSEVQLDGHEAFVTIPDYWVHHDFTEVDAGMGAADTWDYILWQKDQRLGEKGVDYLTFAENIQDNIKHVIHVPTLLISDIKLSISEYGAEPIWLGTEAMVFTGPTNRTFGVISDAGKGYDLFVIKRNKLYAGSVRFIKGEWKVSKSFGFKSDIEELLKIHKNAPRKNLNPVYSLDKLSEKKQEHWSENKLQHIKPFAKVSAETTEGLDEMPYHLLAIQSMMADDRFSRSKFNLFSTAGLIEKIDEPQIQEDMAKKEDTVKPEKKQTKPAEKVQESKPNNLQNVVIFITILIFILSIMMSIYVKNPDFIPIDDIIKKFKKEEMPQPTVKIENIIDSTYPSQLVEIMGFSNSMISGIDFIYNNFEHRNVSFLSVGGRDMQLEIMNGEEVEPELTDLGAMINYSVQGIDCCGGFKHFYDFKLPLKKATETGITGSVNSFQAAIATHDVLAKKLQSIDKGSLIQTPFILKITGEQNRINFFKTLQSLEENILLRKSIIKTDPETGATQSVFYISIFERKGA